MRRPSKDPNPDPSMSYPMRVGRCLHTEAEDKAGDANRAVKGVDATNAIVVFLCLLLCCGNFQCKACVWNGDRCSLGSVF